MYIPGGSEGKESACSAGYLASVPGLGRSPGEGNDYPIQYSCLENSMDRRAWQATVHEVAESDMTEQLTYNSSVNIFTFLHFFPEDTNFYLVWLPSPWRNSFNISCIRSRLVKAILIFFCSKNVSFTVLLKCIFAR